MNRLENLEKVGRILVGLEPTPPYFDLLLELAMNEVGYATKRELNPYEMIGLLAVLTLKGEEERALEVAKKFRGLRFEGSSNAVALAMFLLSRHAKGPLKGFLMMMGSSALLASRRADPYVIDVAIKIGSETKDCTGLCAAYMSVAFSDIFALSQKTAAYELAWRAFEQADKYKPVAALWLPAVDESDVARIESALKTEPDEDAVKAFNMTVEEYKEKAQIALEVAIAEQAFVAFLETGELSYLEEVLPKLKSSDDEVRYMRGKFLALIGQLRETKDEFGLISRKPFYDRAILAYSVAKAFLGEEASLVVPYSELARFTAYVLDALQGKRDLSYVEERIFVDIATNAIVDIVNGEKPERLRRLELNGFADLVIFMSVIDRRETLRLLYFTFI
ncbi:MAG: hypothetical protein QXU93_11780 [Thermoproteus sp.]